MPSMYRADHVGSLLRPPAVLEAVTAGSANGNDPNGTAIVDDAIREAIARQQAAGLDVFTDGEFRRTGFMGGLNDAVDGVEHGEPVEIMWRGGTGDERAVSNARLVTGTLTPTRRIAGDEAAFMLENSPGPVKVTLPSSSAFGLTGWHEDRSRDAYQTREDLIDHTARLLADEAGALSAEGVAYIQVDAPQYTIWSDPKLAARYSHLDFDGLLDAVIAGDNQVFAAAASPDTVTACHLCRGNNQGRWMAEGGYDPIAEKLFSGLACDRLLLEYDSSRAGTFEPLRFVPKDKVVVLGLLSSKTGVLEDREHILRRIEEATQFVPIEQLALSPQCGFASTAEGNPLTEDEQWRKLELVGSVAAEVWGQLS
jgi:5-methyltetrahydropteroyltriglutamate--homocysteine methyltransferase